MLRGMTLRARIQPYLTNHSIRATTVTVLSAANYESRHIKALTCHQSEASIESYGNTPTFHQFKAMSNAIADFVDSGCSSADPPASLVAESTGMTAASSSIHSTLASPDENNVRKLVEIQQSLKNSQHLVQSPSFFPFSLSPTLLKSFIQLVWYILRQLFTSVSVKVVDIYLHFGE